METKNVLISPETQRLIDGLEKLTIFFEIKNKQGDSENSNEENLENGK